MAGRRIQHWAAGAAAACLAGALAVACSGSPLAGDLRVQNGTTRAITVLVDGAVVGTVAPGASASYPQGGPPGGVWTVEARLPGGRTVLKGDVDPSFANQSGGGGSGSGLRADLSCGRLDVWAGVQMMGGAPRPGATATATADVDVWRGPRGRGGLVLSPRPSRRPVTRPRPASVRPPGQPCRGPRAAGFAAMYTSAPAAALHVFRMTSLTSGLRN